MYKIFDIKYPAYLYNVIATRYSTSPSRCSPSRFTYHAKLNSLLAPGISSTFLFIARAPERLIKKVEEARQGTIKRERATGPLSRD